MKTRQHPELTCMSGIAILMVLMIHASASCLGSLYPSMTYAEADYVLRVIRNLVTAAVPMFVFASGCKYALHDLDTPYRNFLKKRLPRVLMSFFIINTLFWAIDSIVWMEQFDAVLLAKTYISSWLGNTVAYPLWYIPMYCFVIITCPLVGRIITNEWLRVALWLVIGMLQQGLEGAIPWLGEKPIMFLAYPVFFELGVLIVRKNYDRWFAGHSWLSYIYIGLVACVSAIPAVSSFVLTEYLLYCIVGTFAYYGLSFGLQHAQFLIWVGNISYPIFLLHEPIIGRSTGALLRYMRIGDSLAYVVLWSIIVFMFTVLLIQMLRKINVDRILWEFRLHK